MSDRARKKLQDLDVRIRARVSGDEMWQTLLTEEEQGRLGGQFEQAWRTWGTLGMWMKLRGLTNRFAALVELAYRLDFLARRHYPWLLRESSLVAGAGPRPPQRPHWDPESGVLTLNGKQIRKVRLFAPPSHVQCILDAFQNAGWPKSIRNPLDDPQDQQKLHRAIYQLNRGLRRIRFSGSCSAQVITWQPS
jgi:hypothetical protein